MRFPLRLGLWEAGHADRRANSGLARRRAFALNARRQDTAKPSRPRRTPAMISQQSGFGLGGLTPNLKGMSTMDPLVLPSMPSEWRHKLPQKPRPGMAGLQSRGGGFRGAARLLVECPLRDGYMPISNRKKASASLGDADLLAF